MDDFVLLLNSKNEAKIIMKQIENYLKNYLKLDLNSKSRYYPNKFGCDFCGFIIYETHILLRKRFKLKLKRKIKKWNKLYKNNNFIESKFMLQWNSILSHSRHACSYNFINRCISNMLFTDVKKYHKNIL